MSKTAHPAQHPVGQTIVEVMPITTTEGGSADVEVVMAVDAVRAIFPPTGVVGLLLFWTAGFLRNPKTRTTAVQQVLHTAVVDGTTHRPITVLA